MRNLIILLSVCGAANAAEWSYSSVADDFEGTSVHILSTESLEPVQSLGGDFVPAVLQLRCDEDSGPAYWRLVWPTLIETYVDHVQVLGYIDRSSMQLRFDEGRIYGSTSLVGGWPPEPPTGNSQAVSTYALRAILRNALKSDRMMVRDVAWDGTVLTVSFDLSGLDEGVETLSEHCRRL